MSNGLKVGAGRAVIRYTAEMFPNFRENYTHVHDDSYVQVILMEQDGTHSALVAVGTVTMSEPEKIAEIVEEVSGVPRENVFVHAKHVLSAPHASRRDDVAHIKEDIARKGGEISDEEAEAFVKRNWLMCDAILDAAKEAAESAAAGICPVTMRYAVGYTDVNVNRLVKTTKGWWQGHNPNLPADGSLPVIRFDDADGRAVAILFFCNVAPGVLEFSVLSDGSRPTSGDMAAETERKLDAQYEGAVSVYLTGATGDHWQALRAMHDTLDREGNQTVTDLHEAGFTFIDIIADRLKEAVIKAAEKSEAESTEGGLAIDHFTFTYPGQKAKGARMGQPSSDVEYIQDGENDLGLGVLRIGADTAILFIGVEINCGTWKYIKENSPFKNTMLVEFSNRKGGGYLPEKDFYDKITYQSLKTRYFAGGAERLAEDAVAALKELACR